MGGQRQITVDKYSCTRKQIDDFVATAHWKNTQYFSARLATWHYREHQPLACCCVWLELLSCLIAWLSPRQTGQTVMSLWLCGTKQQLGSWKIYNRPHDTDICFTIFYSGINPLHPPSISNYYNVDHTLLKVNVVIDRLKIYCVPLVQVLGTY